MTTTQRLSKALAAAGVASRRAAEELITQGLVLVNGEVVRVPQTLVNLDKDTIMYDSVRLKREPKIYYLLHKPVGYTCTNAPMKRKRRVIDLLGEQEYRLFTIGRLDRDTSGLLILTNDGHFANRIMHPSSRIPKEYLVKVNKEVLHTHLIAMSEGAVVEGVHVKPLSVTKVRNGTLKVVICDGRKREVRILAQEAGLEVLEL
ncbi:MAG: rRNA pseudouridine synthase, partial [Verrucomicrobia bacterium]|nr:rRNA pseudouridine synthase [Verrucomicrobiota bacterium]